MTRIRLVLAAVALLAIVVAIGCVRQSGEKAGGDRVTAKVEREHAVRSAEARADERAVAVSSATIAARTARADALTDTFVRQTIEDLRHAIDAVPPAPVGASVPAAPVERLRDQLNAGIARANRAADRAAAEP